MNDIRNHMSENSSSRHRYSQWWVDHSSVSAIDEAHDKDHGRPMADEILSHRHGLEGEEILLVVPSPLTKELDRFVVSQCPTCKGGLSTDVGGSLYCPMCGWGGN